MSNCGTCTLCELGDLQKGKGWINNMQGTGSKVAKVMIISDNPSAADASNGAPFEGDAGYELKVALKRAGLQWKEMYKTTAVKCRPQKKATAKHIKACAPYLEDEIAKVQPNLVIALGNTPLQVLTGRTGITKVAGQLMEAEFGGHKFLVLPTFHPTAIFMNPELKAQWEENLAKAFEFQDMTELPKRKTNYVTTYEMEEAKKVFDKWDKEELYAYDLETNGTDPWKPGAKILCISVSWAKDAGYTIPMHHKDTPFNFSELEYIEKRMKKVLERNDTIKVAHNGKFDSKWLRKKCGIVVSGDWLYDLKDNEYYTKFQPDYDTMLAHHILDSTRGTHGLKVLASKLLGMEDYDAKLKEHLKTQEIEDGGEINYEDAPAEVLFEYAAADVDATLQLYKIFTAQIEENEDFDYISNNITMPVNKVLCDMEFHGTPINYEYLLQLGKDLEKELGEIEVELFEFKEIKEFQKELMRRQVMVYLIGAYKHIFMDKIRKVLNMGEEKDAEVIKAAEKCKSWKTQEKVQDRKKMKRVYDIVKPYSDEFMRLGRLKDHENKSRRKVPDTKERLVNLASNPQVQELLFDQDFFALPTPVDFEDEPILTKTGNPSTAKEAMSMLAGEYEIAEVFARFKQAQKYYGTFYVGIKEKLDEDNRIHPTFNIHGTASGRLSCSNPNLQQVPRDKRIKNVIQARPGYRLIQADFSQAELRTSALLSNDKNMRDSYINYIDLHKRTAARSKVITGVDKEMDMDGVTKDERQDAKITNFGIIYGRSDVGLSKELKIAIDKAQAYITAVFSEYSDLKKWIDKKGRIAKKEGLSESRFGRVRWLPNAKNGSGSKLSEALRQAVNHAVQSTASDVTLLNLIRLHIIFKELELRATLIITVHDSIIAEVHEDDLDATCIVMKEVMETPVADWIDIPWQSDIEFGQTWGGLLPHYEHIDCTKCGEKEMMQIRHTTQEVFCEECDHEQSYAKTVAWIEHCKESKKPFDEFLAMKPKKKKKDISALVKKRKKKVSKVEIEVKPKKRKKRKASAS